MRGQVCVQTRRVGQGQCLQEGSTRNYEDPRETEGTYTSEGWEQVGRVSLRRALQSSEMLAGCEELDRPAMSEVGRVSLAHFRAQDLQIEGST